MKATRLLQDDPGLSISVIIGQVRSTAIDLLRGSGMTGKEARTPSTPPSSVRARA